MPSQRLFKGAYIILMVLDYIWFKTIRESGGGTYMGTVVRLEHYTKNFKKVTVLDDINLTLESGKVIGLKGKNGSGKTMLMRAISGLILPTSGKVFINDKELGKQISFPPSIGLLIENPSFIANYTGFKNLKILASIQNKISDEEIREAIRKVGLKPDDPRTFKKYSLGMKQRLGIAAAIMEKPDIVILDEPINALDEAGAGLIKGILDELKANGSLIIIACHDTEELNYLSDEVYEIYEGQLVDKEAAEAAKKAIEEANKKAEAKKDGRAEENKEAVAKISHIREMQNIFKIGAGQ